MAEFGTEDLVRWSSNLSERRRRELIRDYGPGPFRAKDVRPTPQHLRKNLEHDQCMRLNGSRMPQRVISGALLEKASN